MPRRGPARTGARPLAWSAPDAAREPTETYGRGDTQVHALRGIDLDLPRGGFTAIMLTARQNIPLPLDLDAASYADTVITLQDGRIA
jgi:hypothetical protein